MDKLTPTVGASSLFDVLRSREPNLNGREFSCGSVKSVCMHAGGLIGDHTTGSLVAVLRPEKPVTLWSTGASTPCISAFKPVFWGISSYAPPVFDDPERSREYWLRRERLHRAVIAGKVDADGLRGRIKSLEEDWIARERELMGEDNPDTAKLQALAMESSRQEQALLDVFFPEDKIIGTWRFSRYWKRKNAALG